MDDLTRMKILWWRFRRFANAFQECPSHEYKSLASPSTSDQQLLCTVCHTLLYLYFFLAMLCFEYSNPVRAITKRSFCPCRQGLFLPSNITSSHNQVCCSVTSCKRNAPIMWGHVFRFLIRANKHQILFIFWISSVNIDLLSPGIHSVGCRKNWLFTLALRNSATCLGTKISY